MPLTAAMPEATLVPVRKIDQRLIEFDDWQLFLALHHHPEPWDGLITTDSSILKLPKELSVLMQTKLTLVVPTKAGSDPLRATGLLLTHLPHICKNTLRGRAQIWKLSAMLRPNEKPRTYLQQLAERKQTEFRPFFNAHKLSDADFRQNPLA